MSEKPKNTRLSYLYRDGGNWKAHGSMVFTGTLTPKERRALLKALENGDDGFIPEQVGLVCLVGNVGEPDEELDHPWHEVDPTDWLEGTHATPDDSRTIQAFLAEVLAVKAWDPTLCDECPSGDDDE